ncbi:kinesin-like protein KIN-14C isoform X1 [Lactuca sativa]|uniref:Uncharacterized protein n=1 Tax=Lactuca sativa TaxID=4236 RepID=A0A9R1V4X3_LACSA|nr:kinesin-like protein KIN-14C isoform X1 [Lactuca sativa]KAJ0198311.1 hypothetical protein LSAT_V11C700349620 [Lactuca sativa]
MNSRNQNKPSDPRSPVNNNQAIDDAFIDKLREIDIGWMMASTTASGCSQSLASRNNQKDVTVAPSETQVSEWEIVESTKEEEVDVLLNDKFKGNKFDSKGKHEWMREYIKQLKVCIKWFQENLEDLVKEKDHLRTLLDSSERKRVETEAAMKLKEEDLNSSIIKLENNISTLKKSLANEESQKLNAIDFHNKEKEARMALEKNQDSLKEKLLKAEQNASIANEKVKTQENMYKRLQNELTSAKDSRDDAVKQKEIAVKEVAILRDELTQLREDRERHLSQLHELGSEIVRYRYREKERERTGHTAAAECSILRLKSIAMEKTCSSQREQISLLQHQLDAANKKIKELKGKNIMYQ